MLDEGTQHCRYVYYQQHAQSGDSVEVDSEQRTTLHASLKEGVRHSGARLYVPPDGVYTCTNTGILYRIPYIVTEVHA
jgi:hypothetical protein